MDKTKKNSNEKQKIGTPATSLQITEAPIPTCYDHHADGEDLLIIRLRRHVTKPHRGHASHGEVECCHIHSLPGWSIDQL